MIAGVFLRFAHAQETSSIVGSITDPSGAVVAGAAVTVKNMSTGFTRVVTTDAHGEYDAAAIPTGNYEVTVKKLGFKQAKQGEVHVAVASTQTVNISLAVGASTQTVSVTAAAPLLQMQSAAISNLVDSRQMLALPLISRDFTDLVLLTPGAHIGNAGNLGAGGSGYSMQGGANYSVNGSVAAGNSYMIDGIYDRMIWLNTLVLVPIVDSIQEYRVMTSNYSAEYGNAAGAITEVQTKSGANDFHGDAWEFFRNTVLDANDYFNNLNHIARPPYHRNQFGFTLGGPILKNHTFFFVDYEGTRVSQPLTSTSTIPTLAQDQMIETGNFANFGTTIYNPFPATTVNGVSQRNPFPGNQIPANLLDPVAVRTIGLLPAPTNSNTVNNYTFNANATGTIDQFDVRIDQILHQSDRLFVHYAFDKGDFVAPGVIPSPKNSSIPIGPYLSTNNQGTTEPLLNQGLTVGYTKILTPNMVLQSHAALVRWRAQITPLGIGYNTATALGMPGINFNPQSGGMPAFVISGFQEIGDNSSYPEDSAQTTFQEDSELLWDHGKHSVKAGIVAIETLFNGFSGNPDRGTFDFDGEFTSPLNSSSSATALADFALGAMDSGTRSYLDGSFGMRTWQFSPYVEDTWRPTNRLTITPGLRWDVVAPPYEKHNHWANLDLQNGLLLLAGQDGNGRRLVNFDLSTIAPRLGLNYALNDKTVVHSGGGLSYVYEDVGGNELYKNLPYYTAQVITTSRNTAPVQYLRQGLPVPVAPIGESAQQLSTGSPVAWDKNLRPDMIASWSLGVQRQLTNSTMIDVSYVGTRGNRILINHLNLNQAAPGPGAVGPRRPYYNINPKLVNITYLTGKGQSKYESLQVHAEKRYTKNLTFGVSYTYAEYLANAGEANGIGGNNNYQNSFCIACNWGPTPDDFKHVLSLNHIYNLPFGRGQRYLQDGLASAVFGGWQFTGIWSAESGSRFTPYLSANVSNSVGGGNQRPNQIGSGMLPSGQRTIQHWFNTADFVAPPQYTYGNAGTGMLTGPGYFDADLGLFRSFPMPRNATLTFRSEWFNAFNHANFAAPNATIGTPTAGVISSTVPGPGGTSPRVVQLAVKYVF